MCSITDQRLALIGLAIDELAEAARVAAPDTMAERVARIWAMVADLDPGLAHRLSQYAGQPTTGQPATVQPTTGSTSTGQDRPDPGPA
jgi:hypothetical protein